VDTVLGVSITPTAAALILLEGRAGEGAALDRDVIDLTAMPGRFDDVTAAVLAEQGRRRPVAVGITWADGADTEAHARQLSRSLTRFGLQNTVVVGRAEAQQAVADIPQTIPSELALARGAAKAAGRSHLPAHRAEPRDDAPAHRWRRRILYLAAATAVFAAAAALAAVWWAVPPVHVQHPVSPEPSLPQAISSIVTAPPARSPTTANANRPSPTTTPPAAGAQGGPMATVVIAPQQSVPLRVADTPTALPGPRPADETAPEANPPTTAQESPPAGPPEGHRTAP